MNTGGAGQQNRLLPYLLLILAVLLGYAVYTRVLRPAGPPAAPISTPQVAAPPAPVVPGPAESPRAAATPIPAPSPAPGVVPARPSGRSNPFAALVTEQGARPARPAAPPPLPPVPPPFFPGRPGEGPGASAQPAAAFRVTGTVIRDGVRMAVLQAGERVYFVRVGEIVEGFRIVAVEPELVRVRRGSFTHAFHLREVEAR